MIGKIVAVLVILYLVVAWAPLAYGQRGMGDLRGVAAEATLPDVETLKGIVTAVETGPCEHTTGLGVIGTHVRICMEDGRERNIHLGWAAAVADAIEDLEPGQQVTVEAFRTNEMPEGHYVAKSLSSNAGIIALRDDGLRPLWAPGDRGIDRPRFGRRTRGDRIIE